MTVTLPFTRGSTTNVLPVIAAICDTNSLMSAFLRLIFQVCSCATRATRHEQHDATPAGRAGVRMNDLTSS